MQMWEWLIEKAKDGGLDVIDTYVFWNLHEPSPGDVSCCFSVHSLLVTLFSLRFSIRQYFNFFTVSHSLLSFCFCSYSIILRGGTI